MRTKKSLRAKRFLLWTQLLVLIVAGTLLAVWPWPGAGATICEMTSTPTPFYEYFPLIIRNYPRPTPAPPPGTWHRYRIIYRITLTSYEGATQVWMPVPTNWNYQSNLGVLGYTPQPIDDFVDLHGNRIVYWEKVIQSGISESFSELVEIAALEATWQINPNSVGVYDPYDPVLDRYLGASSMVQTTDPEIQETAQTIVGQETNPYLKAKLIFNFVVDHLDGYASGIQDALGTLRAGKGECGGYSHLFIALCRAVGVPARTVSGIVNWQEGENHFGSGGVSGHVWAEFYLPNYGWIPADPIVTDLNGIDTLGVSLRGRIITAKGPDIVLGHGVTGEVSWFTNPWVNGHQEEEEDLVLIVERLQD